MSQIPLEIDVANVKSKLDDEHDFLLLDCRTNDERQMAKIEPSTLIPMDELTDRVAELGDQDREIIVYCHAGMRSAMVAQWLRKQGYKRAQSMAGGIDAWSVLVDTSCPRY